MSGKRKRWEDLYAEDRIKREKMKMKVTEEEIKRQSIEAETCTFKPNIVKSSKSPLRQSVMSQKNQTLKVNQRKKQNQEQEESKQLQKAIFERNQIWKNQIEESI